MLTAEKIHLVINHFPLLGSLFACFLFVVAAWGNKRDVFVLALFIFAVSAWMTPWIMHTGEAAMESYESDLSHYHLDEDAVRVMQVHYDSAEFWAKGLYAAAVFSTGMLLWLRWGKVKALRRWSLLFVLLTVFVLGSAAWISDSGGKIRRIDFRADP